MKEVAMKKVLGTKVPDDFYALAQAKAKARGLNVSQLVLVALKKEIGESRS
jgi:post-segregation antitoxin (ccd killing protein)